MVSDEVVNQGCVLRQAQTFSSKDKQKPSYSNPYKELRKSKTARDSPLILQPLETVGSGMTGLLSIFLCNWDQAGHVWFVPLTFCLRGHAEC